MNTSWIQTDLVVRHRALPQKLMDGKSGQGMKIQENADGFESTQGGEVDQRHRNPKISVGHRQYYH